MKGNAIVRIIAYSLAIVILCGILVSSLCLDDFPGTGSSVREKIEPTEALQVLDIEYFETDVRNIEIEWVSGSIAIHTDEIITDIIVSEVSPANAKHKMVCKQSGQTLKIKFSEEEIELFGFHDNEFESKDLVIRVPDEWIAKNIEMDVASVGINMDGITAAKFDFDGALGDCRLTDCNVDEIDIDTASGNITFTGTLDVLDCDAASADCNIVTFNIPRSIKMDAASGDLELVLPPNAGFSCEIDSLSSDLKTDFETSCVDSIYYHGDGACKIEMTAMSGDVSILKGIQSVSTEISHDCTDINCTDSRHGHNNHH